MRHYETGVIIAPNLSEEETEKVIQQMTEVVSSMKGNLIREERWGKRKLAYPIKKFTDGFYLFLHYESEPDVPAELERRFRQSDAILRFLTVKKETTSLFRRKKKAEKETPVEAGSEEQAGEKVTAERQAVKAEEKEGGREKPREAKDKAKEVI